MSLKKRNIVLFVLLLSLQVSAQDLKLWYDKPAVKWTEALPIGNGRIGAMLFGGVENDRIQFNEETLWSGGPREYNRKGAYKYLDTIRQLLFQGKQKEAEALAGEQFMGLKSFEAERTDWIKNATADTKYAAESFDDSKWPTMTVPSWDGWETVGFEALDGAVWLRTSFVLPDDWNATDMVFDFNRIRDWDYTYINGKLVGSQQNTEGRKYTVPKTVLHSGKNTIAILVLNFSNKGGVYGYKDTVNHIGFYPAGNEKQKTSLNGLWKYFVLNDDPPPVGTYQADYQPFGDLSLLFSNAKNYTNYKRELDIANAVATTSYSLNGVNYKREYFVSAPNQSLVTHLSAHKKASISFTAELSSPHRNFKTWMSNGVLVLSVKLRTGVPAAWLIPIVQ